MITINNTKYGCSNYIFSLETETAFSIDDYTYKYSKIKVTDIYTIDIPDHINLHLGMVRPEIHALGTEEIDELEKKGRELVKK